MDPDNEWTFEVRKKCAKCDRLSVTYADDETPLCARHATIFMTAQKTAEEGAD